MRANELRIGNYVYWDIPEKQGFTHIVISISANRINTIPISLGESMTNYKPIHITEEWLLKFGFHYHGYDDDGKIYRIGENNDVWIQWDDYYFLHGYKELPLKYVHQLQNLYFALTGEELIPAKEIDTKKK